jgi:hypothetical protein
MFEKFTSADSGDFQRRYQGTFGFFVNKGNKLLTRLDKVNVDGRLSSVEFSDVEGLRYLLKPDSDKEGLGFEFLPPKCAYYNTAGGIPLLINRIPARQYLRGICDRNTSIRDMLGKGYPVDFSTLLQVFANQVTIPAALLAAVKNKATASAAGIAISPQFAISLNHNVITCYDQPIGYAEFKEGVFIVELDSSELWHQEITDAFRRANLRVEFK